MGKDKKGLFPEPCKHPPHRIKRSEHQKKCLDCGKIWESPH